MRKLLVAGTAALFTAVAFAASTVPANAGGVHFNIGVGGFGPGWGPGYGGVYLDDPYYGGYQNNWEAHVDWCFDHKGPSYNPATNKYINQYGKKRTCHSPFA
jgi:hypothetical protein